MKSITPRFKLGRRTFLKGLAGTAVGLPVLECMLDGNGAMLNGSGLSMSAARAQTPAFPRRYAVVFAGQALGADGTDRDQYRLDGTVHQNQPGHFIVPPEANTSSYTVTTPLIPLRDEGLLGDFTLVSGLNIPFNAADATANVPSGGAYRDFHGGGCSPLLSGVRSTVGNFRAEGPTSDQLIAQLNAGQTIRESLVYRAQPKFYLDGYDFSGREYISYTQGGNGGRIEATVNPQTAFTNLFSNFTPEGEDAAALHDFTQRKRLSVLDLVQRKRDRLLGRVSRADRVRLERHFDELRALEVRVGAIPPVVGGTCQVPTPPGAPPAEGADQLCPNDTCPTGEGIDPGAGYSGEAERAAVLADLIHMAFVCDLTRAATLQLTAFQSHMNVMPVAPALYAQLGFTGAALRGDLHEVGHNGDGSNKGQLQVSMMLMWHMGFYARLLKRLKDTPEGDGNVLDNSAIVFMPEAGHGIQLNDGVSEHATHSVQDMVLLIGGRAGGLVPGRHLATGGAVHPAQVLLAAMQAVGYQGSSFGELSGPYADLFG